MIRQGLKWFCLFHTQNVNENKIVVDIHIDILYTPEVYSVSDKNNRLIVRDPTGEGASPGTMEDYEERRKDERDDHNRTAGSGAGDHRDL